MHCILRSLETYWIRKYVCGLLHYDGGQKVWTKRTPFVWNDAYTAAWAIYGKIEHLIRPGTLTTLRLSIMIMSSCYSNQLCHDFCNNCRYAYVCSLIHCYHTNSRLSDNLFDYSKQKFWSSKNQDSTRKLRRLDMHQISVPSLMVAPFRTTTIPCWIT